MRICFNIEYDQSFSPIFEQQFDLSSEEALKKQDSIIARHYAALSMMSQLWSAGFRTKRIQISRILILILKVTKVIVGSVLMAQILCTISMAEIGFFPHFFLKLNWFPAKSEQDGEISEFPSILKKYVQFMTMSNLIDIPHGCKTINFNVFF